MQNLPKVQILPFGKAHISIQITQPRREEEKVDKPARLRPIDKTSAQTRIVTPPQSMTF